MTSPPVPRGAGQGTTIMLLDLTHIRKATDDLDRTLQPADLPQEGEAYRVVAPTRLVCEIHKDHTRFRLVGTVTGELELDCGRCLEPYRLPINMAFDHRFLPQTQAETAADDEREVEADDMDTSYYKDEQIDLSELVREQFYLALPMKPLCAEDCKGLCPQCGTNLNLSRCGCRQVWEDPRLAALKSMSNHDA